MTFACDKAIDKSLMIFSLMILTHTIHVDLSWKNNFLDLRCDCVHAGKSWVC